MQNVSSRGLLSQGRQQALWNERVRLSLTITLSLLNHSAGSPSEGPDSTPEGSPFARQEDGSSLQGAYGSSEGSIGTTTCSTCRLLPGITTRRLPHSFFTFSVPKGEGRVCSGAPFDWNRSCLWETRALEAARVRISENRNALGNAAQKPSVKTATRSRCFLKPRPDTSPDSARPFGIWHLV